MLAVAQMKKEDLVTKNTKSPGDETSVTIKGKNLWIYYHSPSVRSRQIFGVPARSSRTARYGVWAPITPLFCTPTATST
jgi:hypothetical protein